MRAHITLGQNGVMQAFHDGQVTGRFKAQVIPERIARRHIETIRQRQAPQRKVVAIVDHDQIGAGMIDFDAFQGQVWIGCLTILFQCAARRRAPLPLESISDVAQRRASVARDGKRS